MVLPVRGGGLAGGRKDAREARRSRRRRRSRPSAGGAAASRPGRTLHDLLIRRESIGVALIILALLAVPWLVPFTSGLADARNRFVETFGLLIFAWIGAARCTPAGSSSATSRRSSGPTGGRGRSAALAGLFVIGFLGFFTPGLVASATSPSASTRSAATSGDALRRQPARHPRLAAASASRRSRSRCPARAAAVVQNAPYYAQHRVGAGSSRSARRHNARRGFEFIFPTKPAPKGSREGAARLGDVGAHVRRAVADEVDDERRGRRRRARPVDDVRRRRRRRRTTPASPSMRAASGARATAGSCRRWTLLVDKAPAEDGAADNELRAELIDETLASFGVDAHVVQINEGPDGHAVRHRAGLGDQDAQTSSRRDENDKPVLDKDGQPKTRVEEVSRTRVRVKQITSLANDLALALAAPSVRIEAPVPGKPVVGIEVPNTHDVARHAAQRHRDARTFQRASRQDASSRSPSGRASPASRSSPTWRRCRTC